MVKAQILKYDKIVLENINLKAMKKLWGSKISACIFAGFVAILKYQAAKSFKLIDGFRRVKPVRMAVVAAMPI